MPAPRRSQRPASPDPVVRPKPGQLPPGPPPEPEPAGTGLRYRDAVVAQPLGYRPLLLDLVVPTRPSPAPLVIVIYGGAFAMGSPTTDGLGRHLTARLTTEGFAVARVSHRHSREAVFPAQVHDLKAAVRWLRHHAPVLGLDVGAFGTWGASSGGHLAAMLAVTSGRPDLDGELGVTGVDSAVHAAVTWNAPVDLDRLPPPPPESPFHDLGQDPHDWLLGAAAHTASDLAAAASPSTYAHAGAAPIQIVHGEADPAIPVDQAVSLAGAYRKAGAHAELVRVPGAGHFFDADRTEHLTARGVEFLRRRLH